MSNASHFDSEWFFSFSFTYLTFCLHSARYFESEWFFYTFCFSFFGKKVNKNGTAVSNILLRPKQISAWLHSNRYFPLKKFIVWKQQRTHWKTIRDYCAQPLLDWINYKYRHEKLSIIFSSGATVQEIQIWL